MKMSRPPCIFAPLNSRALIYILESLQTEKQSATKEATSNRALSHATPQFRSEFNIVSNWQNNKLVRHLQEMQSRQLWGT